MALSGPISDHSGFRISVRISVLLVLIPATYCSQLMSNNTATEEQLTYMAMELKGLKLIITALRLSTWEFPFKVS
jgi:hypothetical protein